MAIRALIIAVESYPRLQEALAGSLSGTLNNAIAFRDWLINTKGTVPENILFCCEPLAAGATTGATKKEIRDAIIKLRATGAGDTNELYFFFSGHGFAQIGFGRQATGNTLLPSDYENADNTGDLAINHDEIVNRLQSDLGPGVHFHFVDACRHERTEDEFPSGVLAIPPKIMDTGQATVHLLYSTSKGDAARLNSGFGQTLVDGLRGTAKAKTWLSGNGAPRKLVVRFESLVEFIRSRLKGQTPDAEPGSVGNDLIYEFRPPVKENNCKIIVDNAGSNDTFDVRLGNADQVQIGNYSFQGTQYIFPRLPDDYFIEVTGRGLYVEPSGWVPVNLYEDATERFHVVLGPKPNPDPGPILPPPFAPSKQARLDLQLPVGSTGVLKHLSTGREIPLSLQNNLSLLSGKYDLKVDDSEGWTVRRRTIEVSSGSAGIINLAGPPPSPLHEEILKAIPRGQHQGGSADFSESLGGPLADQDPALWLAIMGASHIIKEKYDFSKLAELPLADFSGVPPGGSALYLLVGLEDQLHSLQFGLSNSGQPVPRHWKAVTKVHGFKHLLHHMEVASPGPALLSLALGQTSVMTLTTALLPNRTTLVTVTQDRQGFLQVQQMMLPLAHLLNELPPMVRSRVFMEDMEFPGSRPLRNVKFIVQAQRAFRKRLALDTGAGFRRQELNYLLYGKWLDPVMAALAAYELIRRGSRGELFEAVNNLLTYFPDFPDTAALARIVHDKTPHRAGLPLFLDGLAAFQNYQESLPLPASRLDYRGMWTMWRGAVPNPSRESIAIMGQHDLLKNSVGPDLLTGLH